MPLVHRRHMITYYLETKKAPAHQYLRLMGGGVCYGSLTYQAE